MIIQSWKKEMDSVVRKQRLENKYDIQALGINLHHLAIRNIMAGFMNEGNIFKVMIENGDRLEMQFYSDGINIMLYNKNGRTILLSRADPPEAAENTIVPYQNKLKNYGIGLGSPFPKNLITILYNLLPGEMIVFGNGRSYAAIDKNSTSVYLKPTCKSTDLMFPSFHEIFNSYKTMQIFFDNWICIQKFWSEVRDAQDDAVVARMHTLSAAQGTINKCIGTLPAGQTKKIDFGIISFRVKRSRIRKELTWYRDDGQRISENEVKIIICWLNAAPVVTDFKRKDGNAVHDFNDNLIKSKLNELYKKKAYVTAYSLLLQYCIENKGTLQVSIKSYVKDMDEKFYGESIVFSDNGAYLLNYPDGDFTKDASSIKKIGERDFVLFCEQKFNDSYIYLKNEKMVEIKEQFKNAPEQIAEKVAQNAAMKQMREMDPDIGIDAVEQDISSLIESFSDNSLSKRFAEAADIAKESQKICCRTEEKVRDR